MRFSYGLFLTGMTLLGARPTSAHPNTALEQAALDAFVAEAPADAERYLRRAAHREEHRDWTAAEADLQLAARLAPDSTRVRLALARVYLATDRLQTALAPLNAILDLRPSCPEARVLRARVHSRLGEIAAAHADYSAAIIDLPEPSPGLFLERAALPVASATALRGLDEGLTRLGPVTLLLERALALELRLGRTDAALGRLDVLAAHSERQETWLKRRGDILTLAHRRDEARAAYTAALAALGSLPRWLRDAPEAQQLERELIALVAPSS